MVANVFKRSVVPLLLLMMVITINWTETRFRPTFSSSTCHTGRPDSGSLSSPTQQSREIMSRAFRLLPLTALVAASMSACGGSDSNSSASTQSTSGVVTGSYFEHAKVCIDANNNGKWDTGNYWKKIQPELILPRKQTLNIRANWDNELKVDLK